MSNDGRDQQSSGDRQDNDPPSAAENPFAPPMPDHSDGLMPPSGRPRGVWGTVFKMIGFSIAGLLLLVVVGFGLLIGCCALGAQ